MRERERERMICERESLSSCISFRAPTLPTSGSNCMPCPARDEHSAPDAYSDRFLRSGGEFVDA